jgi:two-component system chemotaxis response regulator CheY
MTKRIALIGHCGPDSTFLRMAVSRAAKGAQVVSADDSSELDRMLNDGVDLLLFNRVLDYGFDDTEGVAIIRKLRATHPNVKMMLVSNYPEAQAEAVAAGALPGFGKREMSSPRVTDLIRAAIEPEPSQKAG